MSHTFDDLADMLLSLGSNLSPAELHGQLAGQMALASFPSDFQWLRQLADTSGVAVEAGSRIADEFVEWSHSVAAAIQDEDLVFHLVLPDDDEPLLVRMEELATWCSGFMAGVAMAGATQSLTELGDDVKELLQDIVSISGLDLSDEAQNEAADFDEITQYLRLAVAQMCIDALKQHQPKEADTFH